MFEKGQLQQSVTRMYNPDEITSKLTWLTMDEDVESSTSSAIH
jgi:hypothetical protein